MSFEEELIITFVDKGLLALILAVIAFGFNWLLEQQKAKDEIRQALSSKRAESFGDLWSKTYELRFSEDEPITSDQRKKLYHELTSWYYNFKGAMYLSHKGAQLFLIARNLLKEEKVDDETIKDAFSNLRTQLKLDSGFYTSREARTPIAKPKS